MQAHPIPHRWRVPAGGYQLLEVAGEPEPVLALAEPSSDRARWADLPPTLCRELAALDGTEAMLAFARRYGGLGLTRLVPGVRGRMVAVEAPSDWRAAAGWVRGALALLDALQTRAGGAPLRGWIRWEGPSRNAPLGRAVVADPAVAFDALDLEARSDRWGYWLRQGDTRGAARMFAARWIDRGLREEVETRYELATGPRAFGVRQRPRNLLGVVWLQVAQLAEGAMTHRVCAAPDCGRWIAVAPGIGGARRRDAVYCAEPRGTRCRQAALRARRRPRRRTS